MYEEKIKKIIKTIKAKRTELGYSQKYMADQLGISQNMYSKIELNKTPVTACKFLLMCELLKLKPADVLSSSKNTLT